MPKVYQLEDHPIVAMGMRMALEGEFEDIELVQFNKVTDLMSVLSDGDFADLYILDGRIGNEIGPEVAPEIWKYHQGANIIGLTTDLEDIFQGFVELDIDVFSKTESPDMLFLSIKEILY